MQGPVNNRTHIKGFTLLEMLVALSLSGMVIVLGFFVYQAFARTHWQYALQVDQQYEQARLLAIMKEDTRKVTRAFSQPEKLFLLSFSDTLFSYEVYGEKTLRREYGNSFNQRLDTFDVTGYWAADREGLIIHWHNHLDSVPHSLKLYPGSKAVPENL